MYLPMHRNLPARTSHSTDMACIQSLQRSLQDKLSIKREKSENVRNFAQNKVQAGDRRRTRHAANSCTSSTRILPLPKYECAKTERAGGIDEGQKEA